MLFRKWGCLVAQGKYIFRKLFEVDQENEPLTTEMVWSSNFHFKPFPGQTRKERGREREKRKPRSERERERRESDDRAGAIDDRGDRAARSTSALVGRARSSDAHRSSARSSIDGAIDDPVAFLLLGFGFFAWFDAFSVKIFEWTSLNLLLLF